MMMRLEYSNILDTCQVQFDFSSLFWRQSSEGPPWSSGVSRKGDRQAS